MGDRAHVKVIDGTNPPLYLYTHWGASTIVNDVHEVLKVRKRWDDPAYLSRMIFDRMKKDSVDSVLGFGISTYEPDGWIAVTVDTDNHVVSFATEDTEVKNSFERFVSDPLVLVNVLNAVYGGS